MALLPSIYLPPATPHRSTRLVRLNMFLNNSWRTATYLVGENRNVPLFSSPATSVEMTLVLPALPLALACAACRLQQSRTCPRVLLTATPFLTRLPVALSKQVEAPSLLIVRKLTVARYVLSPLVSLGLFRPTHLLSLNR